VDSVVDFLVDLVVYGVVVVVRGYVLFAFQMLVVVVAVTVTVFGYSLLQKLCAGS
jgi:hypothetical protein